MKIIREEIKSSSENLIITGLIASDRFCKSIVPILKQNLHTIESQYVKIIARWCITYYEQYRISPKAIIQDIYTKERNDEKYEDHIELVNKFLHHLSDNFEREENYNEQYAIDQAKEYLAFQKIEKANSEISNALKNGEVEEANEIWSGYKKINSIEINTGIDIINDLDKVIEIIDSEDDVLFRLPGALGDIFGDLVRGDLISLAAPSKRGKTWWLFWIAIIAAMYQLRVVIYSFEMTEKQSLKRILQGFLGDLANAIKDNVPKKIKIPTFIEDDDEEGTFFVDYKTVNKQGISIQKIVKKLKGAKTFIKKGGIRLITEPSDSMTVTDLANSMDNIYNIEGFPSDVIILDYPDLMLPEGKKEHRHGIDSVWKRLKGLATKKDVLIVGATHTNKGTFEKDIKQKDMAEDYRKLNHVSIMVALNQTDEEKKKGIMRARCLAHRHENFYRDDIIVLQNLDIGKPYLDSKHESEVIDYMEE